MIIKPFKKMIIFDLVLFFVFLGVLVFVSFLKLRDYLVLIAIIFGVFSVLLGLRYAFARYRTLEISDYGCTVKFLFYKHHYSWNDLKTVRVEDNSYRLCGKGGYYNRAIVFSPLKDFRTPYMIDIMTYMLFCVNPFRFFVVFFRCENIGFFNRCYEVEETQFMKLLEEYGVEVQK